MLSAMVAVENCGILIVIFLNLNSCFAFHKREFPVRNATSPDTCDMVAPWVTLPPPTFSIIILSESNSV